MSLAVVPGRPPIRLIRVSRVPFPRSQPVRPALAPPPPQAEPAEPALPDRQVLVQDQGDAVLVGLAPGHLAADGEVDGVLELLAADAAAVAAGPAQQGEQLLRQQRLPGPALLPAQAG